MINIVQFAGPIYKRQDWTQVFESVVSILEAKGGGTIYVPSGTYCTRSIHLKSNMTLYLEAGAVLEFSDEYENYQAVTSEYEGNLAEMYKPLLFADHAENITVTGYGTLNGNGVRWWEEHKTLKYYRPCLICFQYCKRVKVQYIKLKNSPAWTIHPLYCDDVVIDGVSIQNPFDSPNTDGITPDGSSNIRITNCFIDVGGDCIAMKSGTEFTPDKRSCENISIANCNMLHGHGGIVMGSEMSGGIRNITVFNCTFHNTERGIRIITRRKRGGVMEDLTVQNVMMNHVLCPFTFHMHDHMGTKENDQSIWNKNTYQVSRYTPVIRKIRIGNVFVNHATAAAGFLYGLEEQPIEDIMFTNCSIYMNQEGEAGVPAMLETIEPVRAEGFFLRNVRNIIFNNVSINNTLGKPINKDASVELKTCGSAIP